jgi:hypothetical protein
MARRARLGGDEGFCPLGAGGTSPLGEARSFPRLGRATPEPHPRRPVPHPPAPDPLGPQCCAFDPTDTILAAGDASGRIMTWHGFQRALPAGGAPSNSAGAAAAAAAAADGGGGGGTGAPPDAAACSTVHWHAHAVGCLAFSPDGAYLLSGGAEGVLVGLAGLGGWVWGLGFIVWAEGWCCGPSSARVPSACLPRPPLGAWGRRRGTLASRPSQPVGRSGPAQLLLTSCCASAGTGHAHAR